MQHSDCILSRVFIRLNINVNQIPLFILELTSSLTVYSISISYGKSQGIPSEAGIKIDAQASTVLVFLAY